MYQWIEKIHSPEDLKKIPLQKLPEVAEEYRRHLIESVAQTGGHLGASLGALELNIALHYVLNSPTDKICWDVGHQAYIHKMITGRRERMPTLRQHHGLSGFPSQFESPHDQFIVGHAGTAISQALGLVCARDLQGGTERVVAVAGDGALTAGLAYEALNNAGHLKKDLLVVLNDNEMSISKNVGAISKYLNKVITNPLYNRVRSEVEKQLDRFPRLRRFATASMEGMKHLLVPGIIFEELGYRYFGPVDGHDVVSLVETLRKVLSLRECCLLHIITEKGRGCEFAAKDAERLHGVTPFDIKTGEKIKAPTDSGSAKKEGQPYTKVFVNSLIKQARKDSKIAAITAAMPSGTGLTAFQKEFPDRFFDVGIAEQHAVTFAGAMAKGGMKPICAIYSTFLQRSQDQLIHDVALQRLPLVLALDRAGLVGADGATHNGVFDISYLGHIPHAVIAAPVDEFEMDQMLELAFQYPHIFAVRFPRGNVPLIFEDFPKRNFTIGQGEILREGEDVTFLALGTMVETALKAQILLQKEGVAARVINMRFARPLDGQLIRLAMEKSRIVYTLEEHVFTGGFGSKVLEWLEHNEGFLTPVKRLALPDEFIEHGNRDVILDQFGLSPEKVRDRVLTDLKSKKMVPVLHS